MACLGLSVSTISKVETEFITVDLLHTQSAENIKLPSRWRFMGGGGTNFDDVKDACMVLWTSLLQIKD